MKEIRNPNGKLVCRLDERNKVVEIAHKGFKTTIHFKSNGTAEVVTVTKDTPKTAV